MIGLFYLHGNIRGEAMRVITGNCAPSDVSIHNVFYPREYQEQNKFEGFSIMEDSKLLDLLIKEGVVENVSTPRNSRYYYRIAVPGTWQCTLACPSFPKYYQSSKSKYVKFRPRSLRVGNLRRAQELWLQTPFYIPKSYSTCNCQWPSFTHIC